MIDWTVEATKADEMPYDIFEDYHYWVLTDIDGYHLNECMVAKDKTVDEVRRFFDIGKYPREGTVLKTYKYGEYHPKYRMENTQTVSRSEVQSIFKGIEVEVER